MQELKEFVYTTLTGDSSIQSLLGPSYLDRVHYQYAPDNQKPPYIVHSYTAAESSPAVMFGYWDICVWDAGPNPSKVDALRDRIVALLGRTSNPPIQGFKAVRFRYDEEQMAMTAAPDPKDARIWRYLVRFYFRASAQKDICAIIRENSD